MSRGVGASGRLEGGGGEAGAPLLRRGRCNRSGRVREVARCAVCDVCRLETPRISSLEKQTSVNSFVLTDSSSEFNFLWLTEKTTSSRQPRSTQSCRLRSKPLEHLRKDVSIINVWKVEWSYTGLVPFVCFQIYLHIILNWHIEKIFSQSKRSVPKAFSL